MIMIRSTGWIDWCCTVLNVMVVCGFCMKMSFGAPGNYVQVKPDTTTTSTTQQQQQHHGSTTATTATTTPEDRMEMLQMQLASVVQQLEDTRSELELTRQEMNNRFDSLSATSGRTHPHHHTSDELQVTCRSAFTWWHETVGQTLEYLDRFDIQCHHGEFLRQWRMTWGARKTKKAIRYICCKLVPAEPPTPLPHQNLPTPGDDSTAVRSQQRSHPRRHEQSDWRKRAREG